jgi:DNA-binding response OmpR family regulator
MNVLLVDDNIDYLHLMRDALYANGYTVHTASDGLCGCRKLEELEIDLVISDIRMPKADGLKLHAFAREMDRYQRTKFIFISGFKDVYATMVRTDPEIDFFLEKTTPIAELVRFVDRLMFGCFADLWK